MVREKLIEAELVKRSPRRQPEDHLMRLVAGIAIADPDLSLRDIAAQLDQCMSGRHGVAGNGNRLPSERCWTRPVVSASSALERVVHKPSWLAFRERLI
jgi:hypothetical protein